MNAIEPEGAPATSEPAVETGSQPGARRASRKTALLDERALLSKVLWSVPETAFICRVGVRTVWRLMSDPRSGFPQPRRLGGRTLLVAAEVLAFLEKTPR